MSDQRRILTTLSTAQVVGGIGNGAGLAAGALLIRDVTGSTALAGMGTVMITLGAAVITMPLSNVAAKRGRRPALTFGWLIGSLGALLAVIGAETNQFIFVALGLVGFGSSTAANLQSRFAATDRSDAKHVARSLSLVVWATTIGAVAGPNLVGPGANLAAAFGLVPLAGPFIFSVLSFGLGALIVALFLRPDPLENQISTAAVKRSLKAALPFMNGVTKGAIGAIGASHAIMVAVMSLTPVHMADHGLSLTIIGFTISLHVAGMYALSPIFGWLTDRLGAANVIILGQAVFIVALLFTALDSDHHMSLAIGLTLLGVGWSASVIAAAALVTTSVAKESRTVVQGASDLVMNLSGAIGGLTAGIVVATTSFAFLSWLAMAVTIPVVVFAVAINVNQRSEKTKDSSVS